ncbi:MAG: hypothetical protein RML94_10205 [Bacteroidia bacterium]|nr:hypothetical protein [Bacteroidia bacterium]
MKVKDLVTTVQAESNEKLLEIVLKENAALKERIKCLEEIISNTHRISSEELICMEQIEQLKFASSKRELTLEEVKKLDLLVKNLRLIREQSTQVIDLTTEGVSEDELIRIASTKTK